MKLLFSVVLLLFTLSAYCRQSEMIRNFQRKLDTLAREGRFDDFMNRVKHDTVFKDFEKTFYVSKSEMKDKSKLDSLFGLSEYYFIDAIKGGYHRIIITIVKKGVFRKHKERIFYCEKLFEELTGKKLYRDN